MDDTKTSQQVESYNAKVHRNGKLYYVTIPIETVRKMSIKQNDLVIMKIGRASPPEGF